MCTITRSPLPFSRRPGISPCFRSLFIVKIALSAHPQSPLTVTIFSHLVCSHANCNHVSLCVPRTTLVCLETSSDARAPDSVSVNGTNREPVNLLSGKASGVESGWHRKHSLRFSPQVDGLFARRMDTQAEGWEPGYVTLTRTIGPGTRMVWSWECHPAGFDRWRPVFEHAVAFYLPPPD